MSDGHRVVALDLVGPVWAGDPFSSASSFRWWLDAHADDLGEVGDEVVLRLGEFRDLRDSVLEVLGSLVDGRAPAAEAVRDLNAASAAVPTWPILVAEEPLRPRRGLDTARASVAVRMLAQVARSAIEVAGDAEGRALRRCGATRCGRFFLAGRPKQVWCSPACGNRVRVARHHERRRAAGLR